MITNVSLNLSSTEVSKIHKYAARLVGVESASVSKPCYFPKLIKYKKDLEKKLNINNENKKTFKSQIELDARKFNILSDDYTLTLIMAMIYFARKKNINVSKLFYSILGLKFHSSRIHKHFPKFCNPQIWELSLSKVSPKHLFRSKEGIPNAIMYISDHLYQRIGYGRIMQKPQITEAELIRIVYDLRTRIAQSNRSFANIYYKLSEERAKGVSAAEGTEEISDSKFIADKISQSICTFNQIDSVALNYAVSRSGINRSIGSTIIKEVSIVDFREQIRFIIILLSRISSLESICKENGRNSLIRKVEAGRKIEKYTIKNEIIQMLHTTKSGYRLKNMFPSQLSIFFSHYLTKYMQRKLC